MTDSGADSAAGDPLYQQAKQLVRSSDPGERRRLAERTDVAPEFLYLLATDAVAEVRRQIAANPTTPGQADLLLVEDRSADVRSALARKAADKIPPNGTLAPEALERFTLQVLAALAEDRSLSVRQTLADAVKDLEHAPAAVIHTLAGDAAIQVAGPVLQFSPCLSETDLVQLVRTSRAAGARAAIARRQVISPSVADAIAETDDVEAISQLLANESAQIREETLDSLLERAPHHESWHRPLVRRPHLPSSTARRLSRFVSVALLELLRQHPDLDQAAARAVAGTLKRRLERDGLPLDPDEPDPPADEDHAVDDDGDAVSEGEAAQAKEAESVARAKALFAAQALTDEALDDAIFMGDRAFVIAALALLTEIPAATVDHILKAKSGKGIVALSWRAGFGMPIASKLQLHVAGIPPRQAIKARPGGALPMSEDELRWQLEFFGVAPD